MRTTPFVPTHTLKDDIPQLNLKKGTLLRQINPYAGGHPLDQLWFYDENDWINGGVTWIFTPSEVEPLPNWPEEQQKMMDGIAEKAGWRKTA